LKSHLIKLREICSISSARFLISSISSYFLGTTNWRFYSPPYITTIITILLIHHINHYFISFAEFSLTIWIHIT
jgi:hypothetical protein